MYLAREHSPEKSIREVIIHAIKGLDFPVRVEVESSPRTGKIRCRMADTEDDRIGLENDLYFNLYDAFINATWNATIDYERDREGKRTEFIEGLSIRNEFDDAYILICLCDDSIEFSICYPNADRRL